MPKRSSKQKDVNQLAARILKQVTEEAEKQPKKNSVRQADALESTLGKNLPWIRRPSAEPVIVDLIQSFTNPVNIGKQNATPTPKSAAKRPARSAAPGADRPKAAGNVAQLKRKAPPGNAQVA